MSNKNHTGPDARSGDGQWGSRAKPVNQWLFIANAHKKWSIFAFTKFSGGGGGGWLLQFSYVTIRYTYMSLRLNFLEVVPPI